MQLSRYASQPVLLELEQCSSHLAALEATRTATSTPPAPSRLQHVEERQSANSCGTAEDRSAAVTTGGALASTVPQPQPAPQPIGDVPAGCVSLSKSRLRKGWIGERVGTMHATHALAAPPPEPLEMIFPDTRVPQSVIENVSGAGNEPARDADSQPRGSSGGPAVSSSTAGEGDALASMAAGGGKAPPVDASVHAAHALPCGGQVTSVLGSGVDQHLQQAAAAPAAAASREDSEQRTPVATGECDAPSDTSLKRPLHAPTQHAAKAARTNSSAPCEVAVAAEPCKQACTLPGYAHGLGKKSCAKAPQHEAAPAEGRQSLADCHEAQQLSDTPASCSAAPSGPTPPGCDLHIAVAAAAAPQLAAAAQIAAAGAAEPTAPEAPQELATVCTVADASTPQAAVSPVTQTGATDAPTAAEESGQPSPATVPSATSAGTQPRGALMPVLLDASAGQPSASVAQLGTTEAPAVTAAAARPEPAVQQSVTDASTGQPLAPAVTQVAAVDASTVTAALAESSDAAASDPAAAAPAEQPEGTLKRALPEAWDVSPQRPVAPAVAQEEAAEAVTVAAAAASQPPDNPARPSTAVAADTLTEAAVAQAEQDVPAVQSDAPAVAQIGAAAKAAPSGQPSDTAASGPAAATVAAFVLDAAVERSVQDTSTLRATAAALTEAERAAAPAAVGVPPQPLDTPASRVTSADASTIIESGGKHGEPDSSTVQPAGPATADTGVAEDTTEADAPMHLATSPVDQPVATASAAQESAAPGCTAPDAVDMQPAAPLVPHTGGCHGPTAEAPVQPSSSPASDATESAGPEQRVSAAACPAADAQQAQPAAMVDTDVGQVPTAAMASLSSSGVLPQRAGQDSRNEGALAAASLIHCCAYCVLLQPRPAHAAGQ